MNDTDLTIRRADVNRLWFDATAVPSTAIGKQGDAANLFIHHLLLDGGEKITPSQLVRMLGFYRAAFAMMIRDVGKHYGEAQTPLNASTEDLAALMLTEDLWILLKGKILNLTSLTVLKDQELWEEYADIRAEFEDLQNRFDTLAGKLRS